MSNEEETKRISSSEISKKVKKTKKKEKKKRSKIWKVIKFIIIIGFLVAVIAAGVAIGAFFGMFGDELKIDKSLLKVQFENSTVYDSDGNLIATLSGGTKRKSISLNDMNEYLPKAYVAIEDERFYEHNGFDFGRTLYATFTYVLHGGESKFGGSTITQQVVKNITQEKDNTALAGIIRKVKEISKAIQVEQYLSKDEILELYLNLIFIGGDDINGVELGSIYYFDKSAKDLSLAECAYLAGINNQPNAYKPFETYGGDEEKLNAMKEKIAFRTKTVIGKMLELGFITEDQANEAKEEINNGLQFKKGEAASISTTVSYHTAAAINQIIDQILKENEDMTRDSAEMLLYSSGYKIYTTQNTAIQAALSEEIKKPAYITSQTYNAKDEEGNPVKMTEYSLPTMVIMDHHTGQVVACATAKGSKDERDVQTMLGHYNYPTQIKKQTGSSMKPIAVIAPGLETGMITGATVFDDCETSWGSWKPKDYDHYRGLINMRTAIGVSANIPHAKALTVIGTEAAVKFCESVGLPNFEAEGLSLALGGLNEGVSPLQMCAAYAAIANDGEYISPTFYTKVEDLEGNLVYEPNQVHNQAMTPQNAYLEKEILTEPVTTGTATYCRIPGIETAAKTGTTNNDNDRWLCGFTPYYTAACWYGYEFSATVHYSGNPAGKIWDAVMTQIHEPLPNANFEKPEGVITASVCKACGMLASPASGGNVYTEFFTEENVPKTACQGHAAYTICADTGMLATGACPNQTIGYTSLPPYEIDPIWKSNHALSAIEGLGYCNVHAGVAPGYVTAVDQARFQAATDAAAMGLTGDAYNAYIEEAGRRAAAGQH